MTEGAVSDGELPVFAYGSNLCEARLAKRVGAIRRVAVGCLAEHALRWHKRSTDGSAKCDAFETSDPADPVWGAVYAIDAQRKRDLDAVEGLGKGYDERRVAVYCAGGSMQAIAYIAAPDAIDHTLRPYTWYRDLVRAGARECGLPADYVARIETVAGINDPDAQREMTQRVLIAMCDNERQ